MESDVSTTFNDFVSTVGSSEINFEAGSTYVLTGSLELDGQAAGTRIVLNSSDYSTRFNIDVRNEIAIVDFVDVRNSEALTNDIIAQSSLDTTNTDSGEGSPMWLFGNAISISGSSNLADATSVRFAINTLLQGTTTTVTSGSWTINPAVANPEDIITVWADTVAENLEATGLTEYDGTGNVTSMILNSGTFAIASDDSHINIFMTELGQYDNGNDEDIIYMLSTGNTLDSAISSMGLLINSGSLVTDGYDIDVNGTIDITGTLDATAGAGGVTLIDAGAAWDMESGVFTQANSTVIFVGSSVAQTHDIISGSNSFYNVQLNATAALTIWELEDPLGIDGTLLLTTGTLDTNAAEDNNVTVIGSFIQSTTALFAGNTSTLTFADSIVFD